MIYACLFIFFYPSIQIITEGNRSTLIVNEVFPEDEGEITCTAVNTFGMAQSKTVLTVESTHKLHISYLHKPCVESPIRFVFIQKNNIDLSPSEFYEKQSRPSRVYLLVFYSLIVYSLNQKCVYMSFVL